MTPAMLSRWTLVALCLAAGPADAQPQPQPKPVKPASACGQRLLPLTVGNSWTFEPGKPPVDPPEALTRIIPLQPKKLVVTVVGIEVVDGKSVVKLEEDADGTKLATT